MMKLLLRLYGFVIAVAVTLLMLARPGHGWTVGQAITASPVDSTSPSAVVDSQGATHLVWLEAGEGANAEDVFYAAGDGDAWSTPVNISHSAARSLNVELAITPDDQLVAVWVELQSLLGSRIHYAVKSGETWSQPQALSPWTTLFVGPPALAVHDGMVHAVWAADTGLDGYGDAIYQAVWDGSGWTDPRPLSLDTGTLDVADIAFDAQGRLHLVWDGNMTGDPGNLDAYQVYYAVLDGGAWSEPVDISHTTTYSFIPSLAVDTAGRVHVIWMEEDSNLGQGIHIFDRILYQRLDGGNWLPAPVKLSVASGALFPQAMADAEGYVHFVWSNNTSVNSSVLLFRLHYARWDGERLYGPVQILGTQTPDGGQSRADFVEPATGRIDPAHMGLVWAGGGEGGISQIFYSAQLANQISLASVEPPDSIADAPDLAGRAMDDLHAVWVQGTGPSHIDYSHWNGVRWSNPLPISPDGFDSNWPAIALDPDGAPHVVWFAHDDTTGDRVYYTRLTAGGWLTPTLLSTVDDVAAAPDIAIDAAGDVHVVWEMTTPEEGSRFAIFYRRTTGGGVQWSPRERVSLPGRNSNRPRLALDGAGRPHVVWYDIDGQEIDYSVRDGGGWRAPENVSNTPGSLAGGSIASQGPSIAVDRAGRLHVAWMDTVGGTLLDSILYATRTDSGWTRTTIVSRPDAVRDMDRGAGVNVQVVTGSNGDVHILWHDVGDSSAFHIYDSNSRGGRGWSSPTILSNDLGNAIRPAGYVDDAGRLHLVWTDLQQTRQIFQQRIDRFDWIKVVDQAGVPMQGALLYRNGRPLGQTDARGLFLPEGLAAGDELSALAPVAEFPGVRGGHTSPDGPARPWAYRTYLTNWRFDGVGNRIGEPARADGGEQLLTVRGDSPLVLFNLVVSLEWPATITYTQTFSRALRLASDYLFDASNGQMAMGNVTLYAGGPFWEDADIQVLAFNHNRPNADVNGIREVLAPPVRVGRSWSGVVGGGEAEGAWDLPSGYRTLVHELGHYALGLWDSYFRAERDAEGNLVDLVEAYCTGPEIKTNTNDPGNATLMDYQYNASEFSMRGTAAWSAYCTETQQHQMYGESDWETMRRLFADPSGRARWQLQTPAETGVLTGPTDFPLADLPAIRIVAPVTASQTPLQLLGPSQAVGLASVTLYVRREGYSEAIDQGYSDSQGRIVVLGARDGDVVRALSRDTVYSGQATLQAGITNTLALTRTSGAAAARTGPPPARYLRLLPRSDGRSLDVQVAGIGPGATLDAALSLTGRTAAAQTPLGYSDVHGEYRGALVPGFTDPAAGLDGLGQVRVIGQDVEGRPVYLTSRAAFFSVEPGGSHRFTSPDGAMRLILAGDTLPADVGPVRLLLAEQNPSGTPGEEEMLSPLYQVRLSGSVPGFATPAALAVYLNARGTPPAGAVHLARYDEATGAWQPLPTRWDAANGVASTAIREQGLYVLLGSAPVVPSVRVYLPSLRR